MKKVTMLLIGLALVFSIGFSTVSGGTLCKQTFELIGKTVGDSSMLIYSEHVSGECEPRGYHLVLTCAEGVTWGHVSIPECAWDWAADIFRKLPLESYVELKSKNGVFYINDTMFFRAPYDDSTFWQELGAQIRERNLRGWNTPIYRERTYDAPIMSFDAKLVYRNYSGVYKGYNIDRAYLFPESGFLLLFTHQPRVKMGMDTMHGALVFQIPSIIEHGEEHDTEIPKGRDDR